MGGGVDCVDGEMLNCCASKEGFIVIKICQDCVVLTSNAYSSSDDIHI